MLVSKHITSCVRICINNIYRKITCLQVTFHWRYLTLCFRIVHFLMQYYFYYREITDHRYAGKTFAHQVWHGEKEQTSEVYFIFLNTLWKPKTIDSYDYINEHLPFFSIMKDVNVFAFFYISHSVVYLIQFCMIISNVCMIQCQKGSVSFIIFYNTQVLIFSL